MNAAVTIGRHGLDRRSVVAVARDGALVELGDDAREALAVAAELVARASESTEPVYGVSTGFGSLATTVIPPERREPNCSGRWSAATLPAWDRRSRTKWCGR